MKNWIILCLLIFHIGKVFSQTPFIRDGEALFNQNPIQPEVTDSVVGVPVVKDVSAMCLDSGGIHASIEFDRPFSGRIYSLEFGNVHECVYFNGFYSKRVLFSIPLNGCGTKLSHNTREIVDNIENRVYVQMDKYSMTVFDKKYAFICELTPSRKSPDNSVYSSNSNGVRVSEIRRRPVSSYSDVNQINAKKLQPIIPENVQKQGTTSKTSNKAIVPALLFYGNRQWIVPSENVNFTFSKHNPLPTVLVPESYMETDSSGIRNKPTSFKPGQHSNERDLESEINALNTAIITDSDLTSTVSTTPYYSTTTITTTTTTTTTTNSFFSQSPSTQISPFSPSETTNNNNPWSTVPLYNFDVIRPAGNSTIPTKLSSESLFAKQKSNENDYSKASNENNSSLENPTALSLVNKSIYLEIRRGGNALEPINFDNNALNDVNSQRIVDGSVKIGEPITLVVHAKPASRDPSQFNIFVHSCYSSDGTDFARIQLIDSTGCPVHSQVMGPMRRERISNWTSLENSEIVYYFAMRTFKFPTKNDVYFFCSVDISPDFHFPELCPKANSKKLRRELQKMFETTLNESVAPENLAFQEMHVVSKNLQVAIDGEPQVYQIVQGITEKENISGEITDSGDLETFLTILIILFMFLVLIIILSLILACFISKRFREKIRNLLDFSKNLTKLNSNNFNNK